MKTTCVLLPVYCRINDSRRVFGEIIKYHDGPIYVYVDGLNKQRPAHSDGHRQVVSWVRDIDQQYDQVTILIANENLGCQLAIPTAISWAFDQYEQVIILEDDCLPSPDLFPFMYDLLRHYYDDDRIGMISGNNHFSHLELFGDDYYGYARYGPTWGWATWRRAWRAYSPHLVGLDVLIENGRQGSGFNSQSEFRHWASIWPEMVDDLMHPQTWDARWVYAQRRAGYLSVIPAKNLVRNIGFSPDTASNFSRVKTSRCYILPRQRMNLEGMKHHAHKVVNGRFDRLFFNNIISKQIFWRAKRLLTRINPDVIPDEL